MSIQALRFNNCNLEYQDDTGHWYPVPALNNCNDNLIVPAPPPQDKRGSIAAYLTDSVLKRFIDNAIQSKSNPSDIPNLIAGLSTFVAAILTFAGLPEIATVPLVISGVATLTTAIISHDQSNPDNFETAINDGFYDYARCQLYCLINESGEFNQPTLDGWIDAINGYTQANGAQSVIADNMRQVDKYPLDFWKAAALQGAVIPTTFDPSGCDTCEDPYSLVHDYDNLGVTHGSIDNLGNRTFTLSVDANNPDVDYDHILQVWRVLAKLPYLTRCARLTVTNVTGFTLPSNTDFAAMFRCDDQYNQSLSFSAEHGDFMPQSIDGLCFTRLDLRSTTPFSVTVSIEPCCTDWRVEGASGWIEVDPSDPASIVFDSTFGMYATIDQDKTVAVYRQETHTLPISMSFDVKYNSLTNPTPYQVYESDMVPTSVNDGTPADYDGYSYIITRPYVILKWNVTALTTDTLRSNDPNPYFQKFCYGTPGQCLNFLGSPYSHTLGKLQIVPNAAGCTATYMPDADNIQGCFNASSNTKDILTKYDFGETVVVTQVKARYLVSETANDGQPNSPLTIYWGDPTTGNPSTTVDQHITRQGESKIYDYDSGDISHVTQIIGLGVTAHASADSQGSATLLSLELCYRAQGAVECVTIDFANGQQGFAATHANNIDYARWQEDGYWTAGYRGNYPTDPYYQLQIEHDQPYHAVTLTAWYDCDTGVALDSLAGTRVIGPSGINQHVTMTINADIAAVRVILTNDPMDAGSEITLHKVEVCYTGESPFN